VTGPEALDAPARDAAPVRWQLRWAVLGWVASFVASTVVFILYVSVTGIDDADDLSLVATALLQVPLWVGLLGGVWLASRRQGSGDPFADFRMRFRWSDVPIGLGIGLVTQPLLLVLLPLYQLLGIDPDDIGESARDLTDRAEGRGIVLLILIVAVGAPIVEELFYRGLVLRALEARMSPGWALAVTSLVFGAVHFQPFDLLPLAVFGLVAGLLAQRTGRLGASVFAHMAFNAVAVAALIASR
jgi:uncharacterized protein